MAEQALTAARESAAGRDPREMAAACDFGYDGTEKEGVFVAPFLGSEVRLSYPGFEPVGDEASPPPPHVIALIVYHLAMSDGTPPRGEWCSFGDMPDGGLYVHAFRGYTAAMLVRQYESDVEALDRALSAVGAEALEGLADRAWLVPALPRVPIALLWWYGDEEFATRADLLFDETASRHLPTDGLAVLGSWMTSLLLRKD